MRNYLDYFYIKRKKSQYINTKPKFKDVMVIFKTIFNKKLNILYNHFLFKINKYKYKKYNKKCLKISKYYHEIIYFEIINSTKNQNLGLILK